MLRVTCLFTWPTYPGGVNSISFSTVSAQAEEHLRHELEYCKRCAGDESSLSRYDRGWPARPATPMQLILTNVILAILPIAVARSHRHWVLA